MIFAAFWQTEWIYFNPAKSSFKPAVGRSREVETMFECQAGLWQICCPESSWVSIANDSLTTNFINTLECRSTTGSLNLMPDYAPNLTELWTARIAMMASIGIFLFWTITAFIYGCIGKDNSKSKEGLRKIAQRSVTSISMLILALLTSIGAVIALVVQSMIFQHSFRKESANITTIHPNGEYGRSSKILLSGIIIDWISIIFFAISKYQLSARKAKE